MHCRPPYWLALAVIGAPAEAQRSGFGGERRPSGGNELSGLPGSERSAAWADDGAPISSQRNGGKEGPGAPPLGSPKTGAHGGGGLYGQGKNQPRIAARFVGTSFRSFASPQAAKLTPSTVPLLPSRHCDSRAFHARQSRRILESGSLAPPPAALRCFPTLSFVMSKDKVNCPEGKRGAPGGKRAAPGTKENRLFSGLLVRPVKTGLVSSSCAEPLALSERSRRICDIGCRLEGAKRTRGPSCAAAARPGNRRRLLPRRCSYVLLLPTERQRRCCAKQSYLHQQVI